MNGMIIGILAAICILLAAVSVRENRKYKALEDNVKKVASQMERILDEDTDEKVRHKMYPIKRTRQEGHLTFGGIGMELSWQPFWLRQFEGGITWQDIYHQEFMWRSTNQGQSPWKA